MRRGVDRRNSLTKSFDVIAAARLDGLGPEGSCQRCLDRRLLPARLARPEVRLVRARRRYAYPYPGRADALTDECEIKARRDILIPALRFVVGLTTISRVAKWVG